MHHRAVLFDLDNTLHDRDAGVRAFLETQHASLELAGHTVTLDRWTDRFVTLEERGRVWKDVVYAQLVEEFGLPQDANALLHSYESDFARYVVPHEGLIETLVALRHAGWRTGVLTNGRSEFQRATIAALKVEHLLDVVVVSEECGLRKPQREIFELALREIDCAAEESWFVGDDPAADVGGAVNAKMRALLFGTGGVLSLADVLRIITEYTSNFGHGH